MQSCIYILFFYFQIELSLWIWFNDIVTKILRKSWNFKYFVLWTIESLYLLLSDWVSNAMRSRSRTTREVEDRRPITKMILSSRLSSSSRMNKLETNYYDKYRRNPGTLHRAFHDEAP